MIKTSVFQFFIDVVADTVPFCVEGISIAQPETLDKSYNTNVEVIAVALPAVSDVDIGPNAICEFFIFHLLVVSRNVMFDSAVQPSNALFPMELTFSGMVMLSSEVQLLNAVLPIAVTLFGMVILASDEQP